MKDEYKSRVFSTRYREELLDWLSEIEAAADREHLALVEDV